MKKVLVSLAALVFGALAITACDGPEENNNNANPNGNAPVNGNGNANGGPVVRAPQPKAINAVFTQANFTTEYTVDVDNPDGDEITLGWTGPNCGPWFPENKVFTEAKATTKMSWNHMSPPCPEHSGHDDVTIMLLAVGKRSGRTVTCIYKGASTGVGPTCFQQGFNGSEFGNPQAATAFIRYRNPSKQCSQVELIQVMSIARNGRIVIPHNAGMDAPESGADFTGYQPPAVEDDADGYVVDKFVYKDFGTKDPFYGGAVKGSTTRDAEIDDRPGNISEGHKATFEVCAFCSANPTDAEYGNYLDCFTWEFDPATGRSQKVDPQPTGLPSQGFRNAVTKWNDRHGYTMPAKPQGPK